jgi:hypothetical protein
LTANLSKSAAGFMPYGAAIKIGKYDMSKHPKMVRICEAAAGSPGVKEYLATSECNMEANPMGL